MNPSHLDIISVAQEIGQASVGRFITRTSNSDVRRSLLHLVATYLSARHDWHRLGRLIHAMSELDGNKLYCGLRLSDEHETITITRQTDEGPVTTELPCTATYSHRFGWGDVDKEAAETAFSILCDLFQNEQIAATYYHNFKWRVARNWGESWSISQEEIYWWVYRNPQ